MEYQNINLKEVVGGAPREIPDKKGHKFKLETHLLSYTKLQTKNLASTNG